MVPEKKVSITINEPVKHRFYGAFIFAVKLFPDKSRKLLLPNNSRLAPHRNNPLHDAYDPASFVIAPGLMSAIKYCVYQTTNFAYIGSH